MSTRALHSKEISNVLALSAFDRYQHFLGRIADRSEVWGVGKEGRWSQCADDSGRTAIPFWPAFEYAQLCCADDDTPKVVPLDEWLTKWLPGMANDDVLVACFPTPSNVAVLLRPEQVADDVREVRSNFLFEE
jgi:hypothetical protein